MNNMSVQPRRILAFVGGTSVFGAEIAALDMLTALTHRGHSIHCVVSGWNDGDMIRRIERLGWPYTVAKLGFLYGRRLDWTIDTLRHYPAPRRACRQVLHDFAPDVTYFLGSNALLMLPGFSPPSRTIVYVTDATPATARTRWQYRVLARRAALFMATSRFTAGSLVKQGMPAGRIRVVYPPVTLHSAAPSPVPDGPSSAPRIGIVGQITPRKGHADLFSAAAELARRGLAFTLHVYGRGPADFTAELEKQSSSLGLASRTTFHGYVSDRTAIYGNLDLVVVPSREDEALGLAAAEPGVFGLPVVASDSGGLPEVVLDGKTGLLFRSGDVNDLAEKLARILTEAGLGAGFGAAARDHIGERFGVGQCGLKLESIIEEMNA